MQSNLAALRTLEKALEAADNMGAVTASRECLNLNDRRNLFMAAGGSLDAAMALHEALLPNHSWDNWRGVRHDGVKYYGCNIPGINTVYAAAPARAWLLAIIRALIACNGGDE